MRKLWVCLCCVLCLSACTAKVKDEKVPQVLQEYKKYVNAAHAQIIPNPMQIDAFHHIPIAVKRIIEQWIMSLHMGQKRMVKKV